MSLKNVAYAIFLLFWVSVPALPQTASIWNHNGSIVRLEMFDSSRRIYYVEPRAGLPVKTGDLLFEGQRMGRSYEGTAFLFSQACGKIGYAVTGYIADDDRSVSMTGTAPRRNAQCQITSYFQDRIVFSFLRIENNVSENVETKKTVTGVESSLSRQVAPAITLQEAPPIPIEHTEYEKKDQSGLAITIQNEGIFVAAFCMLLVLGVAFWLGRRVSAKEGSHHQNESSSTLNALNSQYRGKHENKDNSSKMEKNEFQAVDVNEYARDGSKDLEGNKMAISCQFKASPLFQVIALISSGWLIIELPKIYNTIWHLGSRNSDIIIPSEIVTAIIFAAAVCALFPLYVTYFADWKIKTQGEHVTIRYGVIPQNYVFQLGQIRITKYISDSRLSHWLGFEEIIQIEHPDKNISFTRIMLSKKDFDELKTFFQI